MLVVSASVVFTVVVLNLHYRTPDTHIMSPFVRTVLLKWLPWLLMMKRPGHRFTKASIIDSLNQEKKKQLATEQKKEQSKSREYIESESLMRNVRWLEDTVGQHNNNNNIPMRKSGQNIPHSVSDTSVASQMLGASSLVHQIAVHRRESVDMEARLNGLLKPLLSHPDVAGALDTGLHALILMMQRIHMELKFITKRMEKEDEDEDAQNDWKFAAMVVDRLCLIIFSIFIVASTCGIMFSAPNMQLL